MHNLRDYLDVLALSLVVSTTSVTVGKARVFRGLRAMTAGWGEWWGALFHCPYCLSHWIALALVLVYRPRVIHGPFPAIDELVSLFAIVALASVWSRLVCGALSSMDQLTDATSVTPEQRRSV